MFAPKFTKPQTKSAADSTNDLARQRSTLGAARPRHVPDLVDQSQSSSPLAATRLLSTIQAKFVIGQLDDPLEREADRVADQVMGMADPALAVSAAPPQVSRKCAACEEEEQTTLQAKRPGSIEATADEASAIVHEVLQAPGQPLNAESRGFFEPRFRRDFSGVRIHSDARAAESARVVGARAYTVGHNIVFGAQSYSPSTNVGQALLAHELTHVVQQGQADPGTPARAGTFDNSGVLLQRQPADAPVHDTPISIGESPAQRGGVPYEKWAVEIEQQYRARGDMTRANAVRACRDQGLDGCAWILTANEAQRLFALAKESAGDESKVRLGLAGAAPLLARQLPRVAPMLRLVPPLVTPPAPLLTPGAVAGPAVLAAIVVLTSYLLWKIGQFQDELRAKGFIILEDPLALCIGGCHVPGPKSGPSVLNFPPIAPEQLKDWLTQPGAGPRPEQSPEKKSAPKDDCFTENPGATECEDFRSRDDAISGFMASKGFSNIRIGRCTSQGRFTQEDKIDACFNGPGERFHCDVTGTQNGIRKTITISIFACTCCHEDGVSGIEWKNPHPAGR